MKKTSEMLFENAVRCVELIHRLMLAFVVLVIFVAYIPAKESGVPLTLPLAQVSIPVDTARWGCIAVIFSIGLLCSALLKRLSDLCSLLIGSEYLQVLLTYPSVATLGKPWQRWAVGISLMAAQYFAGYMLLYPMDKFLDGSPDVGLAFAYAVPMYFFAANLANWQKSIGKASST